MSELTYEQAIKQLEQIVEKLESSEVSLEESIKLFEEGTKLAAVCNEKLNTAEQKFVQLTNNENQSQE